MPELRTFYRYRSAATLDAIWARDGCSMLSPRERVEMVAWRNPHRRLAWLQGRILAKQLVASCISSRGPAPDTIEILSRDGDGRVNRPQLWCDAVRQQMSLSISHTERGVLVAVSTSNDESLGVDMTVCQPLPAGLGRTWFARSEQQWLADSGSAGIGCFIWAAKEALYKACNRGESFDPRAVEILPDGPSRYCGVARTDVRLRSWDIDGHVAVMATAGRL
jgi:phosphopantetheinyl transferase